MVIDVVKASWMTPPVPHAYHRHDSAHTGVKPVFPWRSHLPGRWNPETARLLSDQGEESLTGVFASQSVSRLLLESSE